jgi:hypothetical protein
VWLHIAVPFSLAIIRITSLKSKRKASSVKDYSSERNQAIYGLAASMLILLFGVVVAQNPLPVIFILLIAITLPVRLFLIFGIILFIVFSNFDLVCMGLYRIIIIIIISSTWTKYREKPSWRTSKKQRGDEQSTRDFSNRHLPTAVTLQAA